MAPCRSYVLLRLDWSRNLRPSPLTPTFYKYQFFFLSFASTGIGVFEYFGHRKHFVNNKLLILTALNGWNYYNRQLKADCAAVLVPCLFKVLQIVAIFFLVIVTCSLCVLRFYCGTKLKKIEISDTLSDCYKSYFQAELSVWFYQYYASAFPIPLCVC